MRSRKLIVAAIVTSASLGRVAYGGPCDPGSTTPAPCPTPPTSPTSLTVPGFTYLHILSDFTVKTSGGSELHLAPGYYLDDPNWKKLDDAFKAKADDDTRLTAENAALKASLSGWQPGWKTLATALAVGLVGGWYLHDKL